WATGELLIDHPADFEVDNEESHSDHAGGGDQCSDCLPHARALKKWRTLFHRRRRWRDGRLLFVGCERHPLWHDASVVPSADHARSVRRITYLASRQLSPTPVSATSGTLSSYTPSISRFTAAESASTSPGGHSKTSSSCT